MHAATTFPLRSRAPAPVDIHLVEDQKLWEVNATERGVARYQQHVADAGIAETSAGSSVISRLMGPTIAAVRELQAEATEAIATAGKGRQPEWWWVLPQIDAEKCAYLTIAAAMRSSPKDRADWGLSKRVTSVALALADSIKIQMEFDDWCAEEKAAQKVARKAGTPRVDMLAALKNRTPTVDKAGWQRWASKIGKVRHETWPSEMKAAIGLRLLEAMVRNSEGWFEIALVYSAGKTERMLKLSAEGEAALLDLAEREAIALPVKRPMICPPRRWERVAANSNEEKKCA